MAATMTRKEFDALAQSARRKFITGGGVVSDPPLPAGPKISDVAVLTRAEFFALTPAQQAAEIRAGRKIVDGQRVGPATENT